MSHVYRLCRCVGYFFLDRSHLRLCPRNLGLRSGTNVIYHISFLFVHELTDLSHWPVPTSSFVQPVCLYLHLNSVTGTYHSGRIYAHDYYCHLGEACGTNMPTMRRLHLLCQKSVLTRTDERRKIEWPLFKQKTIPKTLQYYKPPTPNHYKNAVHYLWRPSSVH